MISIIDTLKLRNAGAEFGQMASGSANDLVCALRRRSGFDRVCITRSFCDIAATALAADFTIAATGAIANDTLTLTTAGSGTDDSGISTLVVNQYRANEPMFETKLKLTSIVDVVLNVGFYKDADEQVEVMFSDAASANFRLAVNASGTVQYLDTGVPCLAATYYKIGVGVDVNGKAFCTINDVLYVSDATITHRMTADPHYARILVAETSANVKVATVKYLEFTWNK
jgi:hypothetical protein